MESLARLLMLQQPGRLSTSSVVANPSVSSGSPAAAQSTVCAPEPATTFRASACKVVTGQPAKIDFCNAAYTSPLLVPLRTCAPCGGERCRRVATAHPSCGGRARHYRTVISSGMFSALDRHLWELKRCLAHQKQGSGSDRYTTFLSFDVRSHRRPAPAEAALTWHYCNVREPASDRKYS